MTRINLFDFDFASSDFEQVLRKIMSHEYQHPDYIPFLITPNADQVLQFNRNKKCIELKKFYKEAYFILPDGFPIILFGKIIKQPLKNKLSGSDLFPKLWDQIKKNRSNTFLIGPTEQVCVLLQKEIPSLRFYVPAFIHIDNIQGLKNEADKIIDKMNGIIPEFLMIGLGFPKQEILMKIIYQKISKSGTNPPLFLLLGASFEFYLHLKKRAPVLFQKTGLEWLHRLSQEPRRLWRRYTIGVIEFIIFFFIEFFRRKFGKSR